MKKELPEIRPSSNQSGEPADVGILRMSETEKAWGQFIEKTYQEIGQKFLEEMKARHPSKHILK